MTNEKNRQEADDALARLADILQKLRHNRLAPDELKRALLGRNYLFDDDSASLPAKFRTGIDVAED